MKILQNTTKSSFAPPGRFFDSLGRLLDASGTHLGSFWMPWTPLGCLRGPTLSCKVATKHYKTRLNRAAPPGRFFDILGRLLDASGTPLGRLWIHFGSMDASGMPCQSCTGLTRCLEGPVYSHIELYLLVYGWNITIYSSLVSPAQD